MVRLMDDDARDADTLTAPVDGSIATDIPADGESEHYTHQY